MSDTHRKGKMLILLFAGVLMGALDISIIGPAIPSIEQTISVDHKALSWIYSIYILFNLIGITIVAKLSDLYGKRTIYVASVSLFALGSVVVALASGINVLLAGRALQGFGASGLFPLASALLGDIYPAEKRGKALGMMGGVFGIAFLLGPIIAGGVLKYFQWNVLFLVNLPLAAIIIYNALRILPNHRISQAARFDWPGILLVSVLLSSFALGINNINATKGFRALIAADTLPFLVIAALALLFFIIIELRTREPVVKIRLFDVKQIRIVGIVAIAAGLIQSVTVFIPEMAVDAFNKSPSAASFMLLPFVSAIAIGSPLSGRMVDRLGSRLIVMSGLFLSAIGLIFLYFSGNLIPGFYTGSIIIGFGTSMLQGSSMRYIMLNEVRPADRALGQGIINLFLSVGQMSGAALIGILVASQSVKLTGYHNSFLSIAVFSIAVLLLSTRLKNRQSELKTASVAQDSVL